MVDSTNLSGKYLIKHWESKQRSEWRFKMAKLTRRYDPYEFETLVMCIKPVERWTVNERKSWVKTQIGFRHFQASNVVPIEHFMPKPLTAYSSPHWKPAA